MHVRKAVNGAAGRGVRHTPARYKALLIASLCGNALALLVLVILLLVKLDVHVPKVFSFNHKPPLSSTAASQKAISKVNVEVWLADTKEAFDAAVDGDFSQCNSNSTADITVTDPKTGEVLASARGTDSCLIILSRTSERVQIVSTQKGYRQVTRECVASRPNEVLDTSIVLVKDRV